MKKNGNYGAKKRNQQAQKRTSNFESRPHQKKEERTAQVNGGVFVYSKPLSVQELSKAINVPTSSIISIS